jgi:hypothetical protein
MHLTRNQKVAIGGLVVLSVIDIAITMWGFFNLQIFYEVNPLFAPFSGQSTPELFLAVISSTKAAVIIGVAALAAWFNTWDRDRLSGGNVCCYGALAVYTAFIGGLILFNSTRVVF